MKRRQKYLLKFILLLGAIRWYNLALIAISQYLIYWLTFSEQGLSGVLYDVKLHLIVLSSICTVAAAFIINAFYDQSKDLVNVPKTVIFGRLLGETRLLNLYFVLNSLAMFFAMMVSLKALAFFFIYALFCWFYSHKLQKRPIVREVSGTILTLVPLFSVWMHHGNWHWGMFYYMGSLSVLLFTRSVLKDLMGHKGNLVFGYQTVVVVTGVKWAKRGLMLLNLGVILLYSLLFVVQKVKPILPDWNPNYYLSISGITLGMSTWVSIAIWMAKDQKVWKILDLFLKIAVVIHLLSIVVKVNSPNAIHW